MNLNMHDAALKPVHLAPGYVGLWVLQYVNKAKNGLHTNMQTLGQPTASMFPLYIHYRSKNIKQGNHFPH